VLPRNPSPASQLAPGLSALHKASVGVAPKFPRKVKRDTFHPPDIAGNSSNGRRNDWVICTLSAQFLADPCDAVRPHYLKLGAEWFEFKLLEYLTTAISKFFEGHKFRNVKNDEASSHCACCEETGAKAESEDGLWDMQVRTTTFSVPLEALSPQANIV
jgi:hypothetical protein